MMRGTEAWFAIFFKVDQADIVIIHFGQTLSASFHYRRHCTRQRGCMQKEKSGRLWLANQCILRLF